MFKLNKEEFHNLIFQFGTSRWGGTRKNPRVFTEHGPKTLKIISAWKSMRFFKVNKKTDLKFRVGASQVCSNFRQLIALR